MTIFLLQILSAAGITFAQNPEKDSLDINNIQKKQEHFYDSLKYRASQKRLTKLVYDFLVNPPRPYVDKKAATIDYYSPFEGKIISEIKIKPLDIFGPTFQDTAKKASSWVEKTANSLHTKSNLKTIEKLLLFKVGDAIDPELLYENERIIRSLPYIREIRFIIEPDPIYTEFVKVTILTKDRFSFGVSGEVAGIESAALEVYNQNIFGVGHEISLSFVGHVNKQPYAGLETYYKIKNIQGKFVDLSFGYLNNYKNEGFSFNLHKPFITTSVKWAYGLDFFRMFRTNRVYDDKLLFSEIPLNYLHFGTWAGRTFQVKTQFTDNPQITLSAGIQHRKYWERPEFEFGNSEYFSNRTFFLTGLTFSQRRYIQDELVFSYGITEDIPEGFKNEIVYGYDANEYGDRHYAHLLVSNGNLLTNRSGYLYMEGDIGGYLGDRGYQQGQINAQVYFISRLLNAGRKRYRLFTRMDYTVGMHRFELENINLNRQESIRGFKSRQADGKQRLRLNFEYVLFLRKEFYKFNMALFGFTDVGVIGTNKKQIFSQNYYSGVGLGMRLHNESLVFKTLQIRLAFYPFHPSDMSFVGFVLDEQSKRKYYSFEPTQPLPIPFE